MFNFKKKLSEKTITFLWVSIAVLSLAWAVSISVYPEIVWLSVTLSILLLATVGILILQNRTALTGRAAAHGLHSSVTIVLVLGILGALNFFGYRYPTQWDFTKDKSHTLSDQTVKILKTLKTPIKATFFGYSRDKFRYQALLDNYRTVNPKFELEYVDPNRELTRARQAGLKKDTGTLQLITAKREAKVDDLTEEKITNALIKVLREKSPTFCALTGHGEKDFNGKTKDGFDFVRRFLIDQTYDVKEVNMTQDPNGLAGCDTIAIMGPMKSFFPGEVQAIEKYLNNGGRAIFALDINLKEGMSSSEELIALLRSWYIKPVAGLILDPVARLYQVDDVVAPVPTFSKTNPITQEFRSGCAFPMTRALEILPGAPNGMTVEMLAQTTATSNSITDLKKAKVGTRLDPTQGKKGPHTVAVALAGKQKHSKAPRDTRIVVFGTSYFVTNNYAKYSLNIDLFLNAVSWTMEDDNLISIRTKEPGIGKVELSQKSGRFIGLLTVLLLPLSISAGGVGFWAYRRKL